MRKSKIGRETIRKVCEASKERKYSILGKRKYFIFLGEKISYIFGREKYFIFLGGKNILYFWLREKKYFVFMGGENILYFLLGEKKYFIFLEEKRFLGGEKRNDQKSV